MEIMAMMETLERTVERWPGEQNYLAAIELLRRYDRPLSLPLRAVPAPNETVEPENHG